MGEILTAEQVGERLQVAAWTVLDWRRAGVIPSLTANSRCVRFDFNAVVAALNKRGEEQTKRAQATA